MYGHHQVHQSRLTNYQPFCLHPLVHPNGPEGLTNIKSGAFKMNNVSKPRFMGDEISRIIQAPTMAWKMFFELPEKGLQRIHEGQNAGRNSVTWNGSMKSSLLPEGSWKVFATRLGFLSIQCMLYHVTSWWNFAWRVYQPTALMISHRLEGYLGFCSHS